MQRGSTVPRTRFSPLVCSMQCGTAASGPIFPSRTRSTVEITGTRFLRAQAKSLRTFLAASTDWALKHDPPGEKKSR